MYSAEFSDFSVWMAIAIPLCLRLLGTVSLLKTTMYPRKDMVDDIKNKM
jgi:hypothetical protein